LANQIADIKGRTVENVIFSQGVITRLRGIEPLVDIDLQRKFNIGKAPIAFATSSDLDDPVDLHPSIDPTQFETHMSGIRKAKGCEGRQLERLIEQHRMPREQ